MTLLIILFIINYNYNKLCIRILKKSYLNLKKSYFSNVRIIFLYLKSFICYKSFVKKIRFIN